MRRANQYCSMQINSEYEVYISILNIPNGGPKCSMTLEICELTFFETIELAETMKGNKLDINCLI